MGKSNRFLALTFWSLFVLSCNQDGGNINPNDLNADKHVLKVESNEQYQSMIGFGGSISWYCDRIIRSPKKNEIISSIVHDLGLDILRLKNWYYPLDYPEKKDVNEMEISWFLSHFNALFTNV